MTDFRLLSFQRTLALPSGRILHSSGVMEESPSESTCLLASNVNCDIGETSNDLEQRSHLLGSM